MSPSHSGPGLLKLKGTDHNSDAKIKKKKKKKPTTTSSSAAAEATTESTNSNNPDPTIPQDIASPPESPDPDAIADQDQDQDQDPDKGKTEAERQHALRRRQRLQDTLKTNPRATQSHKQRVEDLNRYLSGLSEHHDMPRIGPG